MIEQIRGDIAGEWAEPNKIPQLEFADEDNLDRWSPVVRAEILSHRLNKDLKFGLDDQIVRIYTSHHFKIPELNDVLALAERFGGAALKTGGSTLRASDFGFCFDVSVFETTRPDESAFDEQLEQVVAAQMVRDGRSSEILRQRHDIISFFAAVFGLHPKQHTYSIELLGTCLRALTPVVMEAKHYLASRRPVELSAQIHPIIQTPGHSSFPSGHATQAYMLANILAELTQGYEANLYDEIRPYLRQSFQLAARIAYNRVIAGVHFPIDNGCGALLGSVIGQHFVASFQGEAFEHAHRFLPKEFDGRFDSDAFKRGWTEANEPLPPYVERLAPSSLPLPKTEPDKELGWLWTQARAEWEL
ncbi:phosphatase PAP2 family protein [uncultured Ruegeria sp.]|uniref:phosphatase PAP2 family protein n=1 Tax=uncultured Ruegeria sp. TaxID=259304 RepID=UPI00262640D8|nr:phosphatase PAP2 family protein [uncultured Ruegeria sp.]